MLFFVVMFQLTLCVNRMHACCSRLFSFESRSAAFDLFESPSNFGCHVLMNKTLTTLFACTLVFGCSASIVTGNDLVSVNAKNAPNAEAKTSYIVTAPPKSLKLNAFYKKYVSASGYPVISSGKVSDYALKEAAYLIDKMLVKRPDVRKAMIDSGSRMIIMAYNEYTTQIPDYHWLKPKAFWDRRARGLGGSERDPVCCSAEENLLAFKSDPYSKENILIHEFAHNMHLRGMVRVDKTFDARLKKTYEAAMQKGLWKGKYASRNKNEYFAEGVQSWFNNNRINDHDHNHVDTRVELIEYDPGLAAMCKEVFRDTVFEYTKPTTRLTGHMAGYDPSKAPTFRWPKGSEKIGKDILKKANERGKEKK